MAELRSTIQSVYNVTDGSSMVAYNLVVDHQVHTGALMSSDDQIVVQLNKTVGDVVEQLAFNSDTLTAAYATSGNTGLAWNISGTTAILKCASGAVWKNEDIIISATINNIVVDKERISYSSSTPILELSNDVGSLMYSADGTTKLKNDEVATTSATVYVNGNAVPTAQVQFNWNIIDGVGTSSANTVTVSAININAFKAQAVCTATFNDISYQKVFKVMRNTQGIAGVDGKPGTDGKPGADANVIEVFDIYFYRTLQMAQENTPLPVVPDKTATIPSNVPNNADTWTKVLPNGEAGRLIYHSIVTDTKQGSTTTILTRSVSNPTLILAYDGANVQSPESYAQYLTLTNFDQNDALGWSDSGALYIKADYIQSKGILVKKGKNILLAAGGDGDYKEAVQIAGFVVNDHAFYNTAKLGLSSATHMTKPNDTNFDRVPNTNYIYIGTDGIGLVHTGEASGDPPIEKQVYLMGGQIFANAGTIGGWTIKPDMLRYANQAGLLTGNAFYYDNEAGIQNDSDDVRPQGMIRFWSGLYGENTSESDKLVRGNKLHFCVTADGTLYADQAFISGTIKAISGNIGNWTLNTPHLRYGNEVGLYTGDFVYNGSTLDNNAGGNSDEGKKIRIWAGLADNKQTDRFTSGNSANFIVTADGTLYAINGQFDGVRVLNGLTIARSLTSKTRTVINEDGIFLGDPNPPSQWYLGSSNVGIFYNSNEDDSNFWNQPYYFNDKNTKWYAENIDILGAQHIHVVKTIYRNSIMYEQGWRITPTKITGKARTENDIDGIDLQLDKGMGVFNQIKVHQNDKSYGCYIYKDYYLTTGSDAFLQMFAQSSNASSSSRLALSFFMDWSASSMNIWSWNYSLCLYSAQGGKLAGTWKLDNDTAITSARSIKTAINTLTEKHSLLFDNLQPRIFQYKNGSSGRYHYGYIVDELRSAMDIAGLSTTECAAYCLDNPNDPNGTGGIRYSELSVLTTAEVQKLKPRVSDLEQRCIILEARVKELEEKYENIQ